MKKTIILLSMLASFGASNAQTTVFDDFNTSGTRSNYWNFYNSNYITAPVTNPSAVGNTSTEVGQYTRFVPAATNDEYQGLGCKQSGWVAFDFFSSYNAVKVDVYAAQAFTLKLTLQDNGGAGDVDVLTVSQDYTSGDVNTWKTLTFDFSSVSNHVLGSGNGWAILWKFDDGLMNTNDLTYYVDNFVGVTVVTGLKDKASTSSSQLKQNMPNPFSFQSSIDYTLKESGQVSLSIFDAIGKPVTTLINNEFQGSGDYSYTVNAADMKEGIYYYTLTVGDATETKRMVIQK